MVLRLRTRPIPRIHDGTVGQIISMRTRLVLAQQHDGGLRPLEGMDIRREAIVTWKLKPFAQGGSRPTMVRESFRRMSQGGRAYMGFRMSTGRQPTPRLASIGAQEAQWAIDFDTTLTFSADIPAEINPDLSGRHTGHITLRASTLIAQPRAS